ncbi:MAG TPA: hypothetical protein VMF35_08520 [Acidimicrobiales bacterium]|nr:hypothetical protein [Acidimicrobiales bacterium]
MERLMSGDDHSNAQQYHDDSDLTARHPRSTAYTAFHPSSPSDRLTDDTRDPDHDDDRDHGCFLRGNQLWQDAATNMIPPKPFSRPFFTDFMARSPVNPLVTSAILIAFDGGDGQAVPVRTLRCAGAVGVPPTSSA